MVDRNPVEVEEDLDFVLAKSGARYVRYERLEVVPAGSETFTLNDLEDVPKSELEELYSILVGSGVKRFKDKNVLLRSIVTQVQKMPVAAPPAEPGLPTTQSAVRSGPAAVAAPAPDRKAPSIYSLSAVSPTTEDSLKRLAPQARECVSILTDFAVKSSKMVFGEEELKAFFEANKDRLNTRQDAWRVFQYYRRKLTSGGIISVR